ncbi:MAG: 2-hydroxyacyl-CoA dehydratase [Planctomycetaceae bacterium]|jgi:predicted nucleotide-binding protein (sugar kinase/HSP70/actin superfamily)|nr:2-hydroxyacyl-CoA dehydratase [Planctomycetaceae bacterium]
MTVVLNSENIHVQIPPRSPEFQRTDKERFTILCPQMAPIHFALCSGIFRQCGYNVVVLPTINRETIEEGLRYVNNDVCYPAIIVVGQLIQALKSGRYDPARTALLISQTCGGCRSTNYATFLKIAVNKAGFPDVPVIPFQVNFTNDNNKGLFLPLFALKKLFLAFLYGDLLMNLANRCRPYEKNRGEVDVLVQVWVEKLQTEIMTNKYGNVSKTASVIVNDFDALDLQTECKPKVGIVGEILVKYHPGANNNLVSLIEQEGGEAVVPNILDFALYCLTSGDHCKRFAPVSFLSMLKSRIAVWFIERQRDKVRKVLRQHKRFSSFGNIHHLAEQAKRFVSICNQTGEGWLLTGEMAELLEEETLNIICVQPFGCLPNHITGKGVMKELRSHYCGANISTLDYDPGATEVNQLNRIKLLMATALRRNSFNGKSTNK